MNSDTLDVAQRERELRDALTAIEAERQADPAERALDDPQAWTGRERERVNRAAAAATALAELAEFGGLVADPAAMTTIRTYTAASREHRSNLAFVVREGRFRPGAPAQQGIGNATRELSHWWDTLADLAAALPEHPDALRLVDREVLAWLHARTAVADAILAHDGHGDLPRPEDAAGRIPDLGRYRLTLVTDSKED